MAYQPLYATVTDNQGGCGHTLSLRGIVNRVGTHVNTFDGKAMDTFSGYVDGENIVGRPDMRRVPKKDRARVKEEYEDEVRSKTGYWHDINMSVGLEYHDFTINGYQLTVLDKEAINDGMLKELPFEIKEKGIFALLDEIVKMNPVQRKRMLKILGL